MKYCVYCERPVDINDTICPHCGKDISDENTDKMIRSSVECIKCHSKEVQYKIIKKYKNNIPFEEEQYTCLKCGKNFTDEDRLGKSFNNNFQIILSDFEKQLLKWIIVIGITVFVTLNFISNKNAEENSWTHYDCSGLTKMTFKQIKEGAPYDDDKYKGNSYIFTTTIQEINGREVITPIEEDDYSGSYIYFNNEDAEKLKQYNVGDKITFCGQVTKISLYHKVTVKNASLIQ